MLNFKDHVAQLALIPILSLDTASPGGAQSATAEHGLKARPLTVALRDDAASRCRSEEL